MQRYNTAYITCMYKMGLAELVLVSLHGITGHHVCKLHALRVPKYAALNKQGMVNCWITQGCFGLETGLPEKSEVSW
jgi:hypothetical protein